MLKRFKSLLPSPSSSTDPVSKHENVLPANVVVFEKQVKTHNIHDMEERAEAAMDDLSPNLEKWFEVDLQSVSDAMQAYQENTSDDVAHQNLFRSAHNLSGVAETYNRPFIGRVCKSLSRLLSNDSTSDNLNLIELHVEACKTMRTNRCVKSNEEVCEHLEELVDTILTA